jgi:hypothetical protein
MNVNNREPMDTEIIDNLKDKIDINIIHTILDKRRAKISNDNSDNILSIV